MSAPNYYMDRLEKLRDLAKAWPEFVPKAGIFKRIDLFKDDTGRQLTPDQLPALCISPSGEAFRPYSTNRSDMLCGVRLTIFAYVDPNGKAEKELRAVADRTAKVTRFVFSNRRVSGYWWRIEPAGGEFLNWTYQSLSETETGKALISTSADLRLAVSKLDLTA